MPRNERSTKAATMAEALEILEMREKEGGEFGYEQQVTHEYLKKFSKLKPESSVKIKKELEALGISDKIAITIVNVMPVDLMQLKQVLANEKKELEPEVAEKAFAIVEANRSKG